MLVDIERAGRQGLFDLKEALFLTPSAHLFEHIVKIVAVVQADDDGSVAS